MMVWVGGQGLPAHSCPGPHAQFASPSSLPELEWGRTLCSATAPQQQLWDAGGFIVLPLPAYAAAATGLNWESSPPALQSTPHCSWFASPAAAAGTLPRRLGEVPAWAWAGLAAGGPAEPWGHCCGCASKAAMSHVPQVLGLWPGATQLSPDPSPPAPAWKEEAREDLPVGLWPAWKEEKASGPGDLRNLWLFLAWPGAHRQVGAAELGCAPCAPCAPALPEPLHCNRSWGRVGQCWGQGQRGTGHSCPWVCKQGLSRQGKDGDCQLPAH